MMSKMYNKASDMTDIPSKASLRMLPLKFENVKYTIGLLLNLNMISNYASSKHSEALNHYIGVIENCKSLFNM